MQGYWIEMFKPRAKADVKNFLPGNVEFLENPAIVAIAHGASCADAIDEIQAANSSCRDSVDAILTVLEELTAAKN